MLEKLSCTWPPVWVLRQALRDKVLEKRAPLLGDWRRLLLDNVEDDCALTLLDVGRVPVRQFVSEDAQRPNVHLAIVSVLALDQLGGHPTDRADAR